MKKKILFTLLSILLPLGIRAQEAHWQCDEHDFQYDKTIYVSLELEDFLLPEDCEKTCKECKYHI